MPKVKRIRAAALAVSTSIGHAPLGQVIQDDENREKYASIASGRNKRNKKNDDDNKEEFFDEKTSRRILELSRDQQLEEEAERERQARKQERASHERKAKANAKKTKEDSEEEEDDADDDDENSLLMDDETDLIHHDQGYVSVCEDAIGMSAEEEAIVASMLNSGNNDHSKAESKRTLADLILEKIKEKEADQHGEMQSEGEDGQRNNELPPKVVQVYTEIGKLLSRYTSGKLPKAFKVIPSLSNWEEVLYLTRPDMWTPQAMYAATRIFASNLNPKMAQRFYHLVLLDSVRADISNNKKLNYHYYMALKKAVYKPAAFFKGILLPLCKDNCTLREAAIVASVLQRVSIPAHHSAVAIHKLAQIEYSGASSIFLTTLLNKKYALPAPVVDSLIRHFTSFLTDERTLPVLWHQSFLTFVQRYKLEIKDGRAREGLKSVMKKHFHHKITPEIRRELFGAQAWKEERAAVGYTALDGPQPMIQS